MDKPTTDGIGTPDFTIACDNGITLWIEAKAGKNKPTVAQNAAGAWLHKLKHHAYTVWSFEGFIEAIKLAGL